MPMTHKIIRADTLEGVLEAARAGLIQAERDGVRDPRIDWLMGPPESGEPQWIAVIDGWEQDPVQDVEP